MKRFRSGAVMAGAFVAGCSLTPVDPEEVPVYPLDVAALEPRRGELVRWQLAVDEPVASGPIADERIAIREEDGSFSLLANTRWSEPAPALVEDVIVRVLEDGGRLTGVTRSSSTVASDYVLMLELRAFEVLPGDVWLANVVLSAKLVRAKSMSVVAAQVFRANVQAESGAAGVVAAFAQATGRVADDLAGWVVRMGQADWEKHAPRRATTSI